MMATASTPYIRTLNVEDGVYLSLSLGRRKSQTRYTSLEVSHDDNIK